MVRSPANQAPELDADQLIVFLMPIYLLSAKEIEFEKFRPNISKGGLCCCFCWKTNCLLEKSLARNPAQNCTRNTNPRSEPASDALQATVQSVFLRSAPSPANRAFSSEPSSGTRFQPTHRLSHAVIPLISEKKRVRKIPTEKQQRG